MKIKSTYLIITIAIIAIVIIYFSFFWPPVSEEELAGTIGKADKYQSEQMKESDIKLRSDFVKDTAELRKSINDLVDFAVFNRQTITNIESWWLPQLEKYYSSTVSQKNLLYLRDYVELLKNSGKNIQSIVEMLADFYYKRNSDKSVDVDSKLVSFANFVNQMMERDSIFETIIADIDKTVKNSIESKGRSEQIKKLQEIRDKMLYTSLIYAANMRDEDMIIRCAGLEVYKIDNINLTAQVASSVNDAMVKCVNDLLVGFGNTTGLKSLIEPQQNSNFYEGLVYSDLVEPPGVNANFVVKSGSFGIPIGVCSQFGKDLGVIRSGNGIALNKEIYVGFIKNAAQMGLPKWESTATLGRYVVEMTNRQ